MVVKNTRLGGTDYSTPTARIKPTDLNDTNDAIVDQLDAITLLLPPIGSVMPWLKTYTNTPALPVGWVECSGQTLSDGDSVYDGQTIPDLNGDNRFLRGATTSGGTGGQALNNFSTANGWNGSTSKGIDEIDGNIVNDVDFTISNEPPYYDVVLIMRVK